MHQRDHSMRYALFLLLLGVSFLPLSSLQASEHRAEQIQQQADREAAAAPPGANAPPAPAPPAPPAAPPITPIIPQLSVPIPGVTFTAPAVDGGTISIPFLAQYIGGIYTYALGISTIIAIIMVVYGGFKYLLSATGYETANGKEIIKDALMGLLVLYGAYFILWQVNPNLVSLRPLVISTIRSLPMSEDAASDSVARDLDPANAGAPSGASGGGPASLCRENLVRTPRAGTTVVWCSGCGGCGVITHAMPDRACEALTGPCGGTYGQFIAATTGRCRGKTFGWIEMLDGGTFGILHYNENDFTQLLQRMQRRDPTAYSRVIAAGGGLPVTNAALCASSRTDRGFLCNTGYMAMLRAATREPAFTLAQLEDSYEKHLQRRRLAEGRGFHSAYGQAMYGAVMNNPGRCGGGFRGVFAACPAFQGNDETAKIDCFLEQYVVQGCRDGIEGARRRAAVIRIQLANVSQTTAPAPPTLAALEACLPR